jgi:hypothetical protein
MASSKLGRILETTSKTWKAYAKAISILNLTFLIDWMGGFTFMKKGGSLDIGGFKIVREAFSATYGIVFFAFVLTVFLQSGLLSRSTDPPMPSDADDQLDSWFLSPFSDSALVRFIFWLFFVGGFLWLAALCVVHLFLISEPDPDRMSEAIYFLIGVGNTILLAVATWLGKRTYQNMAEVRDRLRQQQRLSSTQNTVPTTGA